MSHLFQCILEHMESHNSGNHISWNKMVDSMLYNDDL